MSSNKIILLMLALALSAEASATNGLVSLAKDGFQPGTRIDLSGQWFYKPGYALASGEQPETAADRSGFGPVAVPQLLNRIHWWLDDSEDFKKHEAQRLAKLGFDTDKAEDGWYHLHVQVPTLPADRHLFLEFEGVAMKCKVYCNGHFLGDHQGMFSRFDFDLTPNLQPGENLIAVYVSMEKIPTSTLSMGEAVTVNLTASKVKTMSKGMYGPLWPGADNRSYDLHGIWQPVSLVVRGPAKIDDAWFRPSLEGGDLQVTAYLLGAQPVTIHAQWNDAKTGAGLVEAHSEILQPGTPAFTQTLRIRNLHPKLWTPADPNLYRLNVRLEGTAGQILDQWSGQVGFRTFEVRGNHFFLNGHPYWLRGADHLPYGKNPWDRQLPRKLIQYLHDANLAITRTHGMPWNETWLDAADEIGLGVSIEGIRPWGLAGLIGLTPPDIFQQWLRENEDVVQRCRNHPSVLIYTIGNEMMLKDAKNVEKWKQLSDVVKQTRRVDPSRPIIASSEYERDPAFYATALQPNGIDDGDIDDLHRYNNWYAESSFVGDSKFEKEMKLNRGQRPLMGQEMSTGYPDLDTGLPVSRYTRDLLTPQAWIGPDAYPGSDPAVFLEHHRAVTKRWAEQLRFQRGTNTAGFMLFASECWFSHSYDPQTLSPYPVYKAMAEADAPIGLAWETVRRRFQDDEKLNSAVFISNDDDQFRDWHDLQLEAVLDKSIELGAVADLPYGKTIRVPVHIRFPKAGQPRRKIQMLLRLKHGEAFVSHTTDPIEVFQPTVEAAATNPVVQAFSLGPVLSRMVSQGAAPASVILLGPKAPLNLLATNSAVRQEIENGATAIVFSPEAQITNLFPDALRDSKKVVAEYADFSPVSGTPLAEGLQAMDLKWWGRTNDWRTFVASSAQRLQERGPARELLRFIPPHGYIPADRVPAQRWTVMSEIPLGQGRLWICDLDLEECAAVDPAARLFAWNLLRAAADSASTRTLPKIPSHEQLMNGRP